MHLNDEEKSMLNGDFGEVKQWALEHQIKVGQFFSANNFISVSQAHMMIDPESIGQAGVAFLEDLVKKGAKVSVPTIVEQ